LQRQYNEPRHAVFVKWTFYEVLHFMEWQVSIFSAHFTYYRHAHTYELVALAIFPRPGFEKPLQIHRIGVTGIVRKRCLYVRVGLLRAGCHTVISTPRS
jgi:hypothetical protein